MCEHGVNTNDDTALRYALLDEARTRAIAMGQIATACQAIEEFGATFDLDVLAAKEEAIVAGLLKTTTSAQLVSGFMVSLLVADRQMVAGEFDRAERILTAAEKTAQKFGAPVLASGVQKRQLNLQLLRAAAADERAAADRLRSRPDDAEANRLAGMYESLVLGDWQKGARRLAKAPPQFAKIAHLEESAESIPANRLPLAAAWKTVADELPPWKNACLAQAEYWRRRASATLAGKSDPALASRAAEQKGGHLINWSRWRTGLRAVLYDGADFQNPHVWRVDHTIALNCGFGPPAPGLPADSFSIRWVGWLCPPVTGRYVFKTYSDDSVRLKIDDKLLIDHWARGAGDETAEIELTDAPHRLMVEFNDYHVSATLSLRWS
ncbi:MAG: PA14 domain-containing protein, partial [Candidatus Saccharimonadales bacterium]